MPFAGGPMAYGRRALGKGFGFFMGWSMFLESLFAAIGTALATGGYVAFLLNPDYPHKTTATICAVVCAIVFMAVQYVGVKEQAVVMLWLTWAAIGALVWFWVAAIPGVSLDRVFTAPLLPNGWSGVLGAVPYALWWLVIIETVALASEEAHEPHISIPRGMVLAQITLVALVVLTWFFVVASFSAVALSGLIVSYSGMIYATSRQAFSLGRAGYLPKVLGSVHSTRRVPDVSLALCTLVSILFIVLGRFYEKATAVAILISTLAAVIWYVLAMVCLFVLRRKEPGLFRPYQTPAFPWLPLFVALLAAFSGYLYAWVNVQVLLPTAILYAAAGVWYAIRGRKSVLAAAPEEVAARIAAKLTAKEGESRITIVVAKGMIEHVTGVVLLAGLLSLVWMVLRATKVLPGAPTSAEVLVVGAIWTALFFLVSFVGFYSTRRRPRGVI